MSRPRVIAWFIVISFNCIAAGDKIQLAGATITSHCLSNPVEMLCYSVTELQIDASVDCKVEIYLSLTLFMLYSLSFVRIIERIQKKANLCQVIHVYKPSTNSSSNSHELRAVEC